MANQVTSNTMCVCSFGAAPMALQCTTAPTVMAVKQPTGTVNDMVCTTFGMCICAANPAVQSATTAAGGVPTPAPCTPVIAGPWKPGAVKVKINKQAALNTTCTLSCSYGGVITIVASPAVTVSVT